LKSRSGFTLVEVVVFMVIVGVAAFALLRSFGSVLPRGPTAAQLTQASQIAQERIELILGRYVAAGFAAVNDPCVGGTPPGICTAPTGYVVTVGGVTAPVVWNANPVTVTLSGTPLAQENAVLANY
jgi:prepilin-type N-terminal cleavage/methylation domain-containing protein